MTRLQPAVAPATGGLGPGLVQRHQPELAAACCAALLAVAYLLLPPLGSDLSAQVARADFFAAHGAIPVDLSWYGGVHQFGYSLVSQPVMAVLGVRATGALALVVAATAFAALLVRTGAPRPMLGGLAGAVCLAGNLASGRVTFGLGVAFGLLALLALTADRPAWRLAGAAAGAVLASGTSPVAGLFVGLVGAALLLGGQRRDGLLLGVAAAVPLMGTAGLFGDGGWMNISRTDTVRAVVTSLLVAALVTYRPVRIGALLSAGGVLAAALVHTPVGLNAARLAVLFALPVLAACARLPARGPAWAWLAGLLAAVCFWQPPVVVADLRTVGEPTTDRAFFAPLLAELRSRPLTGRIEVPPTRGYWEAAHLGEVPLARGWLRQADIDRNPLFFDTVPGAAGTGVPLTVESYRDWLAENAVQYVAVPDAQLSWVGRAEADLIAGGLPYLTLAWSNDRWRLYAVADPVPLVAAPATLVRHDAAALTLDAPGAGDVPVRIRWSRWLTATGGATVVAADGWIVLRVPGPGRYTVTSALG